jgi:hypothetical protein
MSGFERPFRFNLFTCSDYGATAEDDIGRILSIHESFHCALRYLGGMCFREESSNCDRRGDREIKVRPKQLMSIIQLYCVARLSKLK